MVLGVMLTSATQTKRITAHENLIISKQYQVMENFTIRVVFN